MFLHIFQFLTGQIQRFYICKNSLLCYHKCIYIFFCRFNQEPVDYFTNEVKQ